MSYSKTTPALKLFFTLIVTGVIAGLLSACEGDGSPTGGGYPDITYSGIDTQATGITDANADEFPLTLIEGSNNSGAINPLAIVSDPSTTKEARQAAIVNIIIDKISKQLASQGQTSQTIGGAIIVDPGTCGGSITANVSSTNSTIAANYKLDNYCEGGIDTISFEMEMHGEIDARGTYHGDLDTNMVLENLTLNIPYLKVTLRIRNALDNTVVDTFVEEFSGGFDIVYAGATDASLTEITNYPVSISMTASFQSDGLTYKIDNLKVVKDKTTGLYDFTGRFYHPQHGYVDVITTKKFTLIGTGIDEEYCDGSLKLTGADAVIDFTVDNTCTTYDICVTPTGGTQSCTYGKSLP